MKNAELLEEIQTLKNTLCSRATGGNADDAHYIPSRAKLSKLPRIWAALPVCVRTCRDLSSFWSFIKPKFSTYQERRRYLETEFAPVLNMLETAEAAPADGTTMELLSKLDLEHVATAWQKALERRESDPEGAITIARTLLEAVCKHILDHSGQTYDDKAELPALYAKTAELLSLAPNQHTEKIFKQILGSCQAVVEGLGSLRNRLSDAHGRGKKGVKPQRRHAALAVNLAGTMATFLVETWLTRQASSKI